MTDLQQKESRRVILCSLDGVRPDALRAANAPVIQKLAREGAVTWRARTVMPSVTLPCHTSMVRGVDTARHGITTNLFTPLARPVPSILELAHDAGLRTGSFYNWEELRDLAAPGKLTVSMMHSDCKSAKGDRIVAALASEWILREDLDFSFVYFGWPDECAHRTGWMSPPYLDAIANADRCLGTVIEALTIGPNPRPLTILALSDHGGHERTHGTEMPEDMLIPWILWGHGVRTNTSIQDEVRIFDTASTLARLLGIAVGPDWDGRVIEAALSA